MIVEVILDWPLWKINQSPNCSWNYRILRFFHLGFIFSSTESWLLCHLWIFPDDAQDVHVFYLTCDSSLIFLYLYGAYSECFLVLLLKPKGDKQFGEKLEAQVGIQKWILRFALARYLFCVFLPTFLCIIFSRKAG